MTDPNTDVFTASLTELDPEVAEAMAGELARQRDTLEMIASENFVPRSVLQAQGSVLTNKYAEGYPGRRYYGGCEHVDVVENLARDRAKEVFGAKYANVQPHAGAQANAAVLMALAKPGSKIMGLSLAHGGHLTHGMKLNFSGQLYEVAAYEVDPETMQVNMDTVRAMALAEKPDVIIAGWSAYPRTLDFAKFREIADEVGAKLWVDMAHFAGLVAAGLHPSPVPHADVVSTTVHKTLGGPRSGMILTNDEDLAKKFNSAVFPGLQGGPLMHVIAAKAVAFGEALQPEFKDYAAQIVKNAKVLSETLVKGGVDIVSGGTDNHLMLVDLRKKNATGKRAEAALGRAYITCNKNGIPFDPEKPFVTSGIRLGTPAGTTRGFKEAEFTEIGNLIVEVLDGLKAANSDEGNAAVEAAVRDKVVALTGRFPMYPYL